MSNQKAGVGQTLLNVLFFVPGLIYMALRESGKWISKRAYSGGLVRSIMIGLVGVGVAGVSAFSTADFLSHTQGWGVFSWLPASLVVFILTMTHVWPAIYWGLVRHIWNFGDWFLKISKRFAKEIFKPIVQGSVSAMRKAPGSDYLWSIVEGKVEDTEDGKKRGKNWGIRLLQVVLVIGVAAVSAFAGYVTFKATAGLVTIPALSFLHLQEIVAAAIGFTAFYFSGAVLFSLVDEGDAPATAMVYSGLGSYALVTQTGIVSGALPSMALGFVAFLAGVTYIVPAVVAVLQGGLVEKILKSWGKLLDSTYADEDNKAFRKFYQHTMNIIVAVVIAALIKSAVALIGLPVAATWAIAVLAGIYYYSDGSKEFLDRSSGNAMIGLVAAGLAAYYAYTSLPLTGAWLFTATFGVLVGTALIAYPFAYMVVRFLTGWASAGLGELLESVHEAVSASTKKVLGGVRYIQRKAFDDRTGFGSLFGHILNVAVAYVAVVHLVPMAQPYLPVSGWVGLAVSAVIGINLFVLLDRVFSRYGAETLSLVSGGTTMFVVGHAVLAATGSWLSTVVVALTAGAIIGGIVAPVAYLIVRAPANLILTSWLGPIADKVFDAIWSTYATIWSAIGKQFAWLTKLVMVFLGPIVSAVASAWASVKAVLERFTGGKR